ncbi:MAG: DUF2183 domain-containing protein, partial [Hyphomicrobiales bacterium]|nr:DUF2183 domain-containing protein [Hyphomicrobiales bacterium]
MKFSQWATAFAFIASMVCSDARQLAASPVKSDEDVVVFPVSAVKQRDGSWTIPAHVWVYEPVDWSAANGLVRTVAAQLGIDDVGDRIDTFAARAKWFAVDNEGSKQVTVGMAGERWTLDDTGRNGHAETRVTIRDISPPGAKIPLKVRLPDGDRRNFQGTVEFIPQTGVTVISDIDDTIKISNVLDKQALLENTFLEPHAVTPGMPALYKQLAGEGHHFHYVSASPWQLWPSLQPFMTQNYPHGTVAMRYFRLKDGSFVEFLAKSSYDFKVAAIAKIITSYWGHQFILIGDSGECDPEIYGQMARWFPGRVIHIMIRKVAGSNFSDARMRAAVGGDPPARWEYIG